MRQGRGASQVRQGRVVRQGGREAESEGLGSRGEGTSLEVRQQAGSRSTSESGEIERVG